MARRVKVSGGQFLATVDDGDWAKVKDFRWLHRTSVAGKITAFRRLTKSGRRTEQTMHGQLTGWPRVDHVNGDGLDNRRENLRPATVAQTNHRAARSGAGPYRGVSQLGTDRWWARIRADGDRISLGVYASAKAAAKAYDWAARKFHGEYARLNFPEGDS